MNIFGDFNPYKGLEPFSEEDAEYFFGREYDSEIIASHLMSTRLTILYGGSGVGKTSVLLAGVIPLLKKWGQTSVLVFRSWQHKEFLSGLKLAIADLVATPNGEILPYAELSLDDLLAKASQISGGQIEIIFDQFEEYFLYNPDNLPNDQFEAQFAAAVNRPDVHANFVLSLREDGLSLLNRFKKRIPNLFNNHVLLERLDRKSGERAIRMPLSHFNNVRRTDRPPIEIDDDLVKDLLDECVHSKGASAEQEPPKSTENGGIAKDTPNGIEVPILQMVLTRIWEQEKSGTPPRLRQNTLKALGRVEQIIKTHLDGVLLDLNGRDQEICFRIFDRLVTPDGRKIAYSGTELEKIASDLGPHVDSVLEFLSNQKRRILRRIKPPVDPKSSTTKESPPLYEFFHDVLALAALDWRRRYRQALEKRRDRKSWLRRLYVTAGMASAIILFIAYEAYASWLENRPWGYLRELSTGTTHDMRDSTILLGRWLESAEPKRKQISANLGLRSRMISRYHLFLMENEIAIDLRSLNGTTVNAELLPYGMDWNISSGDIVVLAGVVGLTYNKIEYSPLQFWTPSVEPSTPPEGVAILIDGRARNVTYLTGDAYFLSQDADGHYVASNERNKSPLMEFRVGLDGIIVIRDRDDGVLLQAEAKAGDYQYNTYNITPGVEFEVGGSMIFRYGYAPFQIVPFNSPEQTAP